jgi:hypothetical protein
VKKKFRQVNTAGLSWNDPPGIGSTKSWHERGNAKQMVLPHGGNREKVPWDMPFFSFYFLVCVVGVTEFCFIYLFY